MRRWIFAALLLANIGLLIWGAFYLEIDRSATPVAQPPVAPEKMRPLDKKESARARPIPARTPTPALAKSVCYRIGPLPDADAVQRIEQDLAGVVVSHTRRDDALRLVTGYRVYLPPAATKEAAEKKRRELTKLGFNDHALMHDEGFQNALSLGLFSVEDNAQSRIRTLAEKGIEAKLQVLEQTRHSYWIDMGEAAPDILLRVKGSLATVPGADVQESPCSVPAAPAKDTATAG